MPFICAVLFGFLLLHASKGYDQEYIVNYIQESGYDVTEYRNITTKDEYVLTLFRVNADKPRSTYKGTVFFMHGILASGEIWFLNYPSKTLPFLLADDGYDVWIGNNRGCYQSPKHLRYDSDRLVSPYWNFSFHEIAIYDVTAMIDFVLDVTKCKKLIYIGHSQGTTVYFSLMSTLPEYNDKIHAMFALAPVVYLKHAQAPIFRASKLLEQTLPRNIPMSVLDNSVLNYALTRLCAIKEFQNICASPIYSLAGPDNEEFDKSLMSRLYRQYPAGGSIKQLLHFLQIRDSDIFRQYDYLRLQNLKYYNSEEPPVYPLSKITSRVHMYYAHGDWLSSVQDVKKLHKRLRYSDMTHVNYTVFNHFNYFMSKDINTLLHDSVREKISKINSQC